MFSTKTSSVVSKYADDAIPFKVPPLLDFQKITFHLLYSIYCVNCYAFVRTAHARSHFIHIIASINIVVHKIVLTLESVHVINNVFKMAGLTMYYMWCRHWESFADGFWITIVIIVQSPIYLIYKVRAEFHLWKRYHLSFA